MHSHYGINPLTKIKLKIITDLLFDAYKQEVEDFLRQQWLVLLGKMDNEHFIPWEDYKKESMKSPQAKVDIEQILKDAEEIKNLDQSTQ